MTTNKLYVRSQDGISEYRDGAKGLTLSRKQIACVLTDYMLTQLDEEGFAPLSNKWDVCEFLKNRRESLGLTVDELSKSTKLSNKDIEDVEDSSTRSPIRNIVKIAQALAIPQALLVGTTNQVDADLAFRLKGKNGYSSAELTSKDVLTISEAAWVIRTESELRSLLDKPDGLMSSFQQKDSNYGEAGYPVWQHAKYLANKTRDQLRLTHTEPIKSCRALIEEKLGLPLVQATFNWNIAGATISNDGVRGILLNRNGQNKDNYFVLRMTLAHELGHLLWDDETNLNHCLVDNYTGLDSFEGSPSFNMDSSSYYIEARANAFAAEFLAPQTAVRELYLECNSVREVMEYFGISFTCAKYQIFNALDKRINMETLTVESTASTDYWDSAENYSTEFFWDESIPKSRRGIFAKLVVDCETSELITPDSAASYLGCTLSVYNDSKSMIRSLFDDKSGSTNI